MIQCGTQRDAEAALRWAQERVERLGLRLHPEKTRVVNDREAGFDFLGFHHRRVIRFGSQKESHGVLRWPSARACQKFRERIKWLVGPSGRLRASWKECRTALHRYQRGWVQYYRHGESSEVFGKLDWYVSERVARNLARSQPKGARRRRRRWQDYQQWWWQAKPVPTLGELARAKVPRYRGQAKVRWRAV